MSPTTRSNTSQSQQSQQSQSQSEHKSSKFKFKNDDNILRRILTESKNIALIGASDKPHRDSYEIMGLLLEYGYNVYPVNPLLAAKKDNNGSNIKLYNRTVYSSMKDIASKAGIKIDLVDIFRKSDQVENIVNEIIDIGDAKCVWFQIGVNNDIATKKAINAGLLVARNVCPYHELPRLGITGPNGPNPTNSNNSNSSSNHSNNHI
jgi:predicted CoA-binding protein